jgi:hypothetical protein
MSLHIYRVTARGQFDHPDDECRRALLAAAPEHAVARAAFTAAGTLTYEVPLVSFSFRYELRIDDDEHDPPEAAAVSTAEQRALADLDARGIAHRHLRVQATDMADVWRRERR